MNYCFNKCYPSYPECLAYGSEHAVKDRNGSNYLHGRKLRMRNTDAIYNIHKSSNNKKTVKTQTIACSSTLCSQFTLLSLQGISNINNKCKRYFISLFTENFTAYFHL